MNLAATGGSVQTDEDGNSTNMTNIINTRVGSSKPIFVYGTRDGTTTAWVNTALAGTQFVYVPYRNDNQTIVVHSLEKNSGATTVKIYINGTDSKTMTVNPGASASWGFAGVDKNIEIISDKPILAYAYATNADANVMVPASNIIYGSVSQRAWIGAIGNTRVVVDYYCTDGSTGTVNAGQSPTSLQSTPGGGERYSGKSCKYVARDNRLIGALTVADGDGGDGTKFFAQTLILNGISTPIYE